MNNEKLVNYLKRTPGNTNPAILKQLIQENQLENHIQADWLVTDKSNPAYVKNKPVEITEDVIFNSTEIDWDYEEPLYLAEGTSLFTPINGLYQVNWGKEVFLLQS
jgi:hypothetical protein